MNFEVVEEFEKKIAEFFGAPFAVAVDSCTHGLELCLRFMNARHMVCPKNTYLSVPMLAKKIGIQLTFIDRAWIDYYWISGDIADAAVLWKRDSYINNSFMCISFQYQKHLSLGRGGMILCPTKEWADTLKKMSYDGRIPNIPWRDQDVKIQGYHYYMTPETAALGLQKLPEAIATEPRKWSVENWPDLTQMTIFK